jgi:hypothetical protein
MIVNGDWKETWWAGFNKLPVHLIDRGTEGMKMMDRATHNLYALILGACMMVGLGACADRVATDNANKTPEKSVVNTSALTASDAGVDAIVDTGKRSGLNHSFDLLSGGASATVLALYHNVWITNDGQLEIKPTPSISVKTGKPTTDQDWSYQMRIQALDREKAPSKIGPIESMQLDGSTLSARFSGEIELSYEHRPDGLEQRVQIKNRPPGDGLLRVRFATSTDFEHRLDNNGDCDVITGDRIVFRWEKLVVFDATGSKLAAKMVSDRGELRYEIDDRGAQYPILVDPLATAPDAQFNGDLADADFGRSVALDGDLNNDNFADLVVGQTFFTSNAATENFEGRFLTFHGSATGLSATANATFESDIQFGALGQDIQYMGDLNGDGFDDLAVSSLWDGLTFGGGIDLFLGGTTGVVTSSILALDGEASAGFGSAMAAGDINCDGLTDLVIGSYNFGGVATSAGRLQVFHGQATSPFIGSTASTTIDHPTADEYFGVAVATGNFNGDSNGANPCMDVVVGATQRNQLGATDVGGEARIYLGSTGGLSTTESWTTNGVNEFNQYGFSVATADLNQDSFDDVIVGELRGDGSIGDQGRVHGYFGSATGPSTTASWIVEGGQAFSEFGAEVANLGDINGDSLDDIAVGATNFDNTLNDEGAAFIYLGRAGGPATTADESRFGAQIDAGLGTSMSAGSIRNNGRNDFVISAEDFDATTADLGAVFVYFGRLTCFISNNFVSDAEPNPTNECEACDAATNNTAFTTVTNGTSCNDGDACTTSDSCQTGVCAGTPRDCDDANECTQDSCNAGTGACDNLTAPLDGSSCTDDGLSCTSDLCNAGACEHSITGGCTIGGACIADGATNPLNTCEVCDAAADDTDWTNVISGTSCNDSLFCNENEVCDGAGSCGGGNAVDCSGLLDTCVLAASCDEGSNSCQVTSTAANGTACDDSNACTVGDQCFFGACTSGSTLDCDDSNTCTTDSCDAIAGCVNANVIDGTGCDDGTVCTSSDVCTAGACGGSAVNCDDSNQCTADACDAVTGCANTNLADGTGCDDGTLCTSTDVCTSGSCAGTTVDCDDSNTCTADSCDAGTGCSNTNVTNGTSCDDGDACTSGDSCQTGACSSGSAVSCDDSNDCTTDACDAVTGCANTNLADGTGCDDGTLCTSSDVCSAGSCGGSTVDCNDSNGCTADSCDAATGCANTDLVDGTTCDDSNTCTTGDSCLAGSCNSGSALDCDDSNTCTTDSCDITTGCANAPVLDGTTCDDSSACTGTIGTPDSCQAGACASGATINCDDSNQCTTDACDTVTGCSNNTVVDGTSCDDSDACTSGDSCQVGACLSGSALDCNDSNTCTADSCDSVTGCANTNVTDGTSCSDSDTCTGTPGTPDSCQSGTCSSGATVDCDDSNQCTTDACDAITGCSNATVVDGTSCDDSDACTTGDSCQTGACTSGTALDCDDSNVCTADSCDTATGCANAAVLDGTSCDDSDACTGTIGTPDSCQSGACSSGVSIDCDDSNDCTTDSCDATTGCGNVAVGDGTTCDDSDACTTGESCQTGACGNSTAVDCDDSNDCTADSCDTATGCANTEVTDGTACDDGDNCTSDVCQTGACQGTTIDCTAFDDQCNAGQCNATSGNCDAIAVTDGTTCDDADACTSSDSCQTGTCSAGGAVICDDGNQCTDNECDLVNGCEHPNSMAGTSCANTPTLACVTDACDGTGGCARTTDAGSCVVADTCFADQDANPAEVCQICDATTDQADWSNLADGTTCGADACNAAGTGVVAQGCTSGTCIAQPDTDCGAYLCDAANSVCFSACTDASECETGAECASGLCVTERPTADITGPSEAVCGETIMLSGSNSNDPNMLALTYEWSQTLGAPNLLDSVDTTEETISVEIPAVLDMGVIYRFQLIVSNGGFDSDPIATDVTVMACPQMMDDSSMEPEPDMGADTDAGPTADMDAGPTADMDAGPAPDGGADSGPIADADAAADTGGEAASRAFLQGGACASVPTDEPPSALLLVCLLGLLIGRRRRSKR